MSDDYKDIKVLPYLNMVWRNKLLEDGTLLYKNKPEGESRELIFQPGDALAYLLAADQVFLNDFWWMGRKHNPDNSWPEEATKVFSVNANCNDVFAWGCADAENINYGELEDLYNHYTVDDIWGTAVWCIKKRGIMPQEPVEKAIRNAGIWDLDSLGLKENPSEKYYREQK